MARPRGPHRAVTAVVALALVLAPVGVVVAAPSPDYPSWDEVQAANKDAAAAEAAAARIEAALAELEAQAVRLGRDAQLKAEESFIAQSALDDATARADALRASADAAETRANASATVAAQSLVELSRSGAGDPTLALLFAGRREADDLLRALAAASRLGETSQGLLDRAVADRNSADALVAQASVAEDLRQTAADEAAATAAEAEKAVETAAAEAAAQQANLDRMFEQLAVLRGTSADLERAFWEGQNAESGDPGSGGSGSGGSGSGSGDTGSGGSGSGSGSGDSGSDTGSGGTGSGGSGSGDSGSGSGSGDTGSGGSGGSTDPDPDPDPSPAPTTTYPAPNSGKVNTAITYAKAQLGEPYVYGGAGPSGWDCSGLTMQSYAAAGVSIGGHGSTSQYNYLKSKGRLVPYSERAAGDLLFYSDGGSTSATKYHVALYLGGGKMIEAPYPGQVVRIVTVRTLDLVPYVARPTA